LPATQEALETREIKATKEMMVLLVQREKGEEWEFQVNGVKLVREDSEENVVERGVKDFLDPKVILVSQAHLDLLV